MWVSPSRAAGPQRPADSDARGARPPRSLVGSVAPLFRWLEDTAMARQTPLEQYRNIGIMAHIDAGKTTTTERILYYTGQEPQDRRGPRGRGHHGLDGAGAGARHHDHLRRHDLLLDPRTAPSTASTSSTRRATSTSPSRWSVRCACSTARSTLLDSVAGVEPQTETVWRQADRYGVPRLIFANKMDRVGADFDRCLAMIRDRLTQEGVPDPASRRRGRDVHRPHRRARAGSRSSSTTRRSARRSPRCRCPRRIGSGSRRRATR